MESLKIENTLLKQVNAELEDKNVLLKDLLHKGKTNNNTKMNKKSYMNVVTYNAIMQQQ